MRYSHKRTQHDHDKDLYDRLRSRSFERDQSGGITNRDPELDADEDTDSYREIPDPSRWYLP